MLVLTKERGWRDMLATHLRFWIWKGRSVERILVLVLRTHANGVLII